MPLRFVNFEQLHMNVKDFLSMSRAQKGVRKKTDHLHELFVMVTLSQRQSHYSHPLTCKTSSTLEEALGTMIEKNVHRLFVEDEAGVPCSVVTYGDIIAAFIQ
jgi:CBS domain-containing protein